MENIWTTKTLSYKQSYSVNLIAIDNSTDIIDDKINIVTLHGITTFDKETKQINFKPNPFFISDKMYIQLEFLNSRYITYVIEFNILDTERPREILEIIKLNDGVIPIDLIDEVNNLGLTKYIKNPPVDTTDKNPPVDTTDKNPPVDTTDKNPPVDTTDKNIDISFKPKITNDTPKLYKEALELYPSFLINNDTYWEKIIHNYKNEIYHRFEIIYNKVLNTQTVDFNDFIITRTETNILNIDFSDKFKEHVEKFYPGVTKSK